MSAFANFLNLVIAEGYDRAALDHSTWEDERGAELDARASRDAYFSSYCANWTDHLATVIADMYPDTTVTTDPEILF